MNLQQNIASADRQTSDGTEDAQTVEGEGFSLVDLLRVIRVRKKIIIGTAAAVVALVTIIVMQMTPLYSGTAVVMLDQRKNNVEDVGAVLSGLPSDQAAVQNQVQILTSQELIGRVVDKLKLTEDPEFNPLRGGLAAIFGLLNPLNWFSASETQEAVTGESPERIAAIHKMLDRLTVSPIGLSTAIKVSFQSESAGKAARITNAIANAYVEDQLEAKFEATRKATTWLSSRISELSKQAQAADAAVQQFKADNNITTTANGMTVVDQQIGDLNNQLITARTELAEKQTNYGRLAALARAGQAENASQVVSSPLIAALRGQESTLTRQMADMSSKYGDRHPKILDMKAQKADLDAKIREEIQRIVLSVKSDAEASQARVSSLQGSLRQLESQGAGQNQTSVKLTALQSSATSARAMYEAFLGRLNQTQNQEGIQAPDARIITNAEVPSAASYPKKGLAIGIAIPAGLILGLMLAFVVERLDSGFRTSAQVEGLLGLPVLTTVPELIGPNKEPVNAADIAVEKPMSSFAEALRGLQLGLTLSDVDKPPKVILVTSSVPGEGKSTISLSLARVASRSGMKVAIIDGDLRRPNLMKLLGETGIERGLLEALIEKRPIEQYLSKDPRSDAMVLPCLKPPANPAEILTSQALKDIVAALRDRFDMVVIDSAPILPVNDTRILSRIVDSVLFVVKWESTPREAAVNAIRSLMDVKAPLAGVAMARADFERFRYYSYGYQSYHNYTKYYSD
jgi:polysaccharide biosynthesis transport protein